MSEHGQETHVTTDQDEIRAWARERDAVPVYETSSEERRHRFVREDAVSAEHERMDWDRFFESFESREMALVYGDGQPPEDAEIVEREAAITRTALDDEAVERRLLAGETVTTEITDTAVVERTVVEMETVETEVRDSEVVRGRITDAELVDWRVVDTSEDIDLQAITETVGQNYDAREGGEVDYESVALDATVEGDVTLEVEETWRVEREVDERLTIESRLVDVDLAEDDEVIEGSTSTEVNVEGIERSLVESGALGNDIDESDLAGTDVVRTRRAGDDVVESTLIRRRLDEDRLRRRRRLRFDFVDTEVVETELEETTTIDESVVRGGYDQESDELVATGAAVSGEHAEAVTLSEEDVGKDVIDEDGHDVGVVVDVVGDAIEVEPEAGIVDQIGIALGWHTSEEDAFRISREQIRSKDDDKVVLAAASIDAADTASG